MSCGVSHEKKTRQGWHPAPLAKCEGGSLPELTADSVAFAAGRASLARDRTGCCGRGADALVAHDERKTIGQHTDLMHGGRLTLGLHATVLVYGAADSAQS